MWLGVACIKPPSLASRHLTIYHPRMKLSTGLIALALVIKIHADCSLWEVCGGLTWYGLPNCCPPGSECVYINPWFSQCLPIKSVTTTPKSSSLVNSTAVTSTGRSSATPTKSTSSVPAASTTCVQIGRGTQCGGIGYTGPFTCPSGGTCVYVNEWLSQCIYCRPLTTLAV
ncbi:hypothetical protein FRC14_007825 [Serendipita sp. 396]|nr:hypothetical protein FRC14_007825 [Serendipita sp. 396]KAG8775030.1 hypothetical protein FRC15_000849 [Serendipita sp. 397]KAG8860390.1 hypothetical protein FRC20_011623 [Serendipita sp. 405]